MQNECSKPRSEKHESATTAAHSIGQYQTKTRAIGEIIPNQWRKGAWEPEICGIPGSTNGPTLLLACPQAEPPLGLTAARARNWSECYPHVPVLS